LGRHCLRKLDQKSSAKQVRTCWSLGVTTSRLAAPDDVKNASWQFRPPIYLAYRKCQLIQA
jgi:hypothetical protein